jgi:alpha-1,3-glucan synthase
MLSQLTKTIKMALKSTEDERAILRARSAVQRFPVIEWRQRMEDLHRRSIDTSRSLAGEKAWRESDCNGAGLRPMAETDDWGPIFQAQPTEPDWDTLSVNDRSMTSPLLIPTRQGSHDSLSAGIYENQLGHDLDRRRSVTPGFNNFLERVNRAISQEQTNIPDSFLDGELQPNRPFGLHSRASSSMESISTIVSEKSNSPLNKAIDSVCSFSFLS